MEIKELASKIKYYRNKGCLIDFDNTTLLAIRQTDRGKETAAILDLRYDIELDCWVIEVKDWKKSFMNEICISREY